MAAPWRVAIITMVPRVAADYAVLIRENGHEPVVVIAARRPNVDADAFLSAETEGLDVVVPASKRSLARVLKPYDLDLALCGGYPWLIPQEAIDVPRLGIVNGHIGMLPRYRGPYPVAWAIRNGETEVGMTFHFMDAGFDTGNVLAQAAIAVDDSEDWDSLWAKYAESVPGLVARVFERLAAGNEGDPQQGGDYYRDFEPEYAVLDTAKTAAEVHRQVRAWSFMPPGGGTGPFLGDRRIVRTSLVEVEDAERLECADGPLWIVDSETP